MQSLIAIGRRNVLIAGLAGSTGLALPRAARAHHGWSSFDESRPIYIAGTVSQVRWQNPHVELTVTLDEKLALPGDLAQRAVPAQTNPVDGKAVLAKAVLPGNPGRSWTLELAPLLRMEAWAVKPIEKDARVAAVGYAGPGEKQTIMRVEYLFVAGNAYGLRSSPAK